MYAVNYLAGRKRFARPQAMIWSDVRFGFVNNGYVPPTDAIEGRDFLVITDHLRGDISIDVERIESRNRMVGGTSRSHHMADKLKFSTDWTDLPSRIAAQPVEFDLNTGYRVGGGELYVVDGGGAAIDMIDWYDTHPGPFWLYLSYDLGAAVDFRGTYSKEYHVFFSSALGRTLTARGGIDLWNINVSLDEV